MKQTLNDLVRAEAARNKGYYNLIKSAPKRELRLIHHDICKQLVKLSDDNHFPMGVLVYIAIGTNAHRPHVFQRGYLKIDVQKAEKVIKLCRLFANKFGDKWYTNDKLVHSCSRYYDYMKGNINEFKARINQVTEDELKEVRLDQAKKLSKIIFKDVYEYSKGGYIIGKKEVL